MRTRGGGNESHTGGTVRFVLAGCEFIESSSAIMLHGRVRRSGATLFFLQRDD